MEELWCLHPSGHNLGRGRKMSPLRVVGRQILQLVYNTCPVLPGNIYGSGFCKFICLPEVFFQSFAVIPPPIQTICRVCWCKRAEAQSRRPEEHPQVREDHTVGEGVVLAAALALIAHQPWHPVQGCCAWFVVTAIYGWIPAMSAKLGCASAVIPCLLGPRWHLQEDMK